MKPSQTKVYQWVIALFMIAIASGCVHRTSPYANRAPNYYPQQPAYSQQTAPSYYQDAPQSNSSYQQPYQQPYQQQEIWGRVSNIEVLRGEQRAQPTGGGAVLGGVIGGIVGNQMGRGFGRQAATAAGVFGGSIIGHSIEQQNAPVQSYSIYRVSIQMANGQWRTFDYSSPPNLRIGDRVRVENDQVFVY